MTHPVTLARFEELRISTEYDDPKNADRAAAGRSCCGCREFVADLRDEGEATCQMCGRPQRSGRSGTLAA